VRYLAPIAVVASLVPGVAVAQSDMVRLQLDALPLAELVTVLYRDVLRTPYAVMPEVGADRRVVSIRINAPVAQARAQIAAYLKAMGLKVTTVSGTDFISGSARSVGPVAPYSPSSGYEVPALDPSGSYGPPSGSMAQFGQVRPVEPEEVGFYRPEHRDPAYLSDIMRSVFPSIRFGSRGSPQQDNGRVEGANGPDVLVFAGPKADVVSAEKLAVQLDTAQAQLSIKATVYEVQTGESKQSALSIALNLLGGKLLGGYLTGAPAMDTFARLKTRNFDATISALNTDNRFKVVTSPAVRARSGTEAVLTSGSQVPVLGAVSYQGDNSTPVQSVEYRDSGVILRVRPTVHGSSIDVDVAQELSSFVRTDTGVNATPTLIKRALTNRLSLQSGDVVVLGGLTEERDEASRSGLFRGFLGSRSKSKTKTEILLILQVATVGGAEGSRPQRSEDATRTPATEAPDFSESSA